MEATKRTSKRFSGYILNTVLRFSSTNNTKKITEDEEDMGSQQQQEPPAEASTRQAQEESFLFGVYTDGTYQRRVDMIPDSELVKLFDVDGPGIAEGGYESARYLGVPIVQIAGMAPSLRPYQKLWRHRYTLEVQLPQNWGSFRQRYTWAQLPESAIRTGDIDADIKIARELCVLLRFSAKVLDEARASGASDLVNTLLWIEEEAAAVRADEERWMGWLRALIQQRGQCGRGW